VGLAWMLYRRGVFHAAQARAPGALLQFLKSAFGFDAMFDVLLVRPYLWLARVLRGDPVDLVFVGLERLAIAAHERLRATQNGRLRRYAGWLMAGSLATLAMLLFA
jgi:NADH-quinone oxidoreductase subunit L